jgi:ATP-dependent DNA ligase
MQPEIQITDVEPLETFPTLYKLDSKGKIREWYVLVDLDLGRYSSVSGTSGGKMTQTEWTQVTPKNVGQSNETSVIEQVILEVEAMYEKKEAREGYSASEELARAKALEVDTRPMLAHKFSDHVDKITYPCYSQPKLDGVRCIAKADGLWTRKGEQIVSCPHIQQALAPVFLAYLDLVVDGELYNHSLKDDFNEIQSLITRKKCTEKSLEKTAGLVQYHVYDTMLPELPFIERLNHLVILLAENVSANYWESGAIQFVDSEEVNSRAELDARYDTALKDGYEGQMVRWSDSPYEHKRTNKLLKRKEFEDAEYEIVEVLEGVGNRSGMAGSIMLKSVDGKIFNSNIKGGWAFYRALWTARESVIGKMATIQFQNLTPDGIPRFPVMTKIRED